MYNETVQGGNFCTRQQCCSCEVQTLTDEFTARRNLCMYSIKHARSNHMPAAPSIPAAAHRYHGNHIKKRSLAMCKRLRQMLPHRYARHTSPSTIHRAIASAPSRATSAAPRVSGQLVLVTTLPPKHTRAVALRVGQTLTVCYTTDWIATSRGTWRHMTAAHDGCPHAPGLHTAIACLNTPTRAADNWLLSLQTGN